MTASAYLNSFQERVSEGENACRDQARNGERHGISAQDLQAGGAVDQCAPPVQKVLT
jgi:hypothetical protein